MNHNSKLPPPAVREVGWVAPGTVAARGTAQRDPLGEGCPAAPASRPLGAAAHPSRPKAVASTALLPQYPTVPPTPPHTPQYPTHETCCIIFLTYSAFTCPGGRCMQMRQAPKTPNRAKQLNCDVGRLRAKSRCEMISGAQNQRHPCIPRQKHHSLSQTHVTGQQAPPTCPSHHTP